MTALLDFARFTKKSATPEAKPVLARQAKDAAWSDAPKIRTIFIGTPELAAAILSGLVEKKYNIVCVITKPDRPAGRQQEMAGSAVKKKALEYGLPIEQPQKLDQETVERIKALKPDLIIVAAYGRLLPKALLDIPGFGCINVHASLLPLWRGASPIQNALLAGDTETGISLMLMDEGMDTGDVLAQKKVAITSEDTTESLSRRLTEAGRDLLLEMLPLWIRRTLSPVPQDGSKATLCQLIEREDGHIIWTESAESIYNRYRALFPWPGIFSFWKKDGGLLRLKLCRVSYQKQSPQTQHLIGQVFEVGEKVGIQTGAGVIFPEEVQLEGKIRLPIAEFLLGNKDIIGSLLQ